MRDAYTQGWDGPACSGVLQMGGVGGRMSGAQGAAQPPGSQCLCIRQKAAPAAVFKVTCGRQETPGQRVLLMRPFLTLCVYALPFSVPQVVNVRFSIPYKVSFGEVMKVRSSWLSESRQDSISARLRDCLTSLSAQEASILTVHLVLVLSVQVVGSTADLGAWNPEAAPAMQ